jgi:RloB-like protein
VLVVCGAKVTERDYLLGLRGAVRNPAVSVKLVEHPRSPSQVVAFTAGLRHRAPDDYDQGWCVLDVDEYPDVGVAMAEADREDVHVALSNPCFELWLLLHFVEHRAYARTYAELLPHLRRHIPGYDKTRIDFHHYHSGWREAVRRGRALAPVGKEHEVNPATGMWRLATTVGGL